MKRILVMIPHEEFHDRELLIVREYLIEKGYRVVLASSSLGFATGGNRTAVRIDMDFEEAAINLHDFSAVVFIGGRGSAKEYQNSLCLDIAKVAFESGKVIAAIDNGPVILAKAGILKGFSVTVYTKMFNKQLADEMKMAGAKYHDADVVVDRNIITASNEKASSKFAEKIAEIVG